MCCGGANTFNGRFIPQHITGGGDTQNDRKRKIEGEQITPEKSNLNDKHDTKDQTQATKSKWKIGAALKERDQLNVLKVLSDNNDRFAYTIEEVERYTGPPIEIKLNSSKDIFRPPHKLGEKEWAFVG